MATKKESVKEYHDQVLTVRATKEQMRLFEEGDGTKYDMDFWGATYLGGNLWEIAFEAPVVFDAHDVTHLRRVAAELKTA